LVASALMNNLNARLSRRYVFVTTRFFINCDVFVPDPLRRPGIHTVPKIYRGFFSA
jgi:hypothetical protein